MKQINHKGGLISTMPITLYSLDDIKINENT